MIETRDEPVARQGYWRVGGPMDRFVVVEDEAELGEVWRGGDLVLVLGNGSNLLVPDAGLRGTTVRLGGALKAVEVEDRGSSLRVRVGAGLANAVLLARLGGRARGLGPLAGVPGTVGGAVAMNAGTALGEIADVLEAVEGLLDGERVVIPRADLPMAYRDGGLPPGLVVTAAVLRLYPDGVAEEAERIRHHLARRRQTQPLDLPSCGSVFRNPPGDHAGRLIEAAGLKGRRIGHAAISERHANFIVNLGGATAGEVMACIRLAWETVGATSGVWLVPEVHVVGSWPSGDWPLRR